MTIRDLVDKLGIDKIEIIREELESGEIDLEIRYFFVDDNRKTPYPIREFRKNNKIRKDLEIIESRIRMDFK